MNDRIEQLLKQSMTDEWGNGLARVDYNKFAQSIVAECEAYVSDHFDCSEPWMRSGDLDRHFGVKF
jgi:hypothetical protein